jgi:hypothetical protein
VLRTGWRWELGQLEGWMREVGAPIQAHAVRDEGGMGYVACTLLGDFADTVFVALGDEPPPERAGWLCPECVRLVREHPQAMRLPVPPCTCA